MTRITYQLFILKIIFLEILSIFVLISDGYAQEVFDFKPIYPKKMTSEPLKKSITYKTLKMFRKYVGEQNQGVYYFNDLEKKRSEVNVRGGLLYDLNGTLLNSNFSSPVNVKTNLQLQTPHPPPTPKDALKQGFAIYVMDERGRFYISFQAEKGKIHHSSFLAGAPVACAGEMLIFQGKLLLINNQSGHYRPPPLALDQALHSLKNQGVDLSNVQVKKFGVDL